MRRARTLFAVWSLLAAACAFEPELPDNVSCHSEDDCRPFEASCAYSARWGRNVCCRGPACGSASDGSVVDGPAPLDFDGPIADGPFADGPAADGPVADGPAADQPTACPPADDCPLGRGTCGGPLCNVVLSTDQHHCGTCGRSCHGAECQDGECLPIVLATNQHFHYRPTVAVGEAGVYWATSDGNVVHLPFAPGSSAAPIATGQGRVDALAVDHDFAYLWSPGPCPDGECVRRVPLVPGRYPERNIASSYGPPGDVGADAGAIYWFDASDHGSIVRVATHPDAANLERKTIASNQGTPRGLAIDDTFVYWTTQMETDGRVRRARKDGTSLAPEPLAVGLQDPHGVAVNSQNVYWADSATGAIQTTPKEGHGPVTTLATGQNFPAAVAADEVNVYWGLAGGGRDLYRAPLCGGGARRAAQTAAVAGMFVWKGDLYWIDESSSVYRMAQ
jgi:hypothetical protein